MEKIKEEALKYFKIWMSDQEETTGCSFGEAWEDQEDWYNCFLAGFQYGILHKANNP